MTHYTIDQFDVAVPTKAPYQLSRKEAIRREASRQFVLASLDDQLGDHELARYARRDADTLTKILFDLWGI